MKHNRAAYCIALSFIATLLLSVAVVMATYRADQGEQSLLPVMALAWGFLFPLLAYILHVVTR